MISVSEYDLVPPAGVRAADASFSVPMTGGVLSGRVDCSDRPLSDLCDFAARRNTKRGFLILSQVLGRHLPSRPSDMEAASSQLARALVNAEPRLDGPLLFVGLAETAVCLGQSVFHAFVDHTGRADALFSHSTRQRIDADVMARFEEPHSHASAHLIYLPDDPAHQALARSARTLVLVDDEITTGATLRNLALEVLKVSPAIEKIFMLSFTDWSGDTANLNRMPVPTRSISLLSGSLSWHPDAAFREAHPVTPEAARSALGHLTSHKNFGRLGTQGPTPDLSTLARALSGPVPEKFFIVGTGEFAHTPYLLGLALERLGHDVIMQATTRSPIRVGGPITSSLMFRDNYQTGVPNYLYNIEASAGRRVLICHETPPGSIDERLVRALHGECLYFGDPA